MSDEREAPVAIDDAHLLQQVRDAVESMGTREATAYAVSHGVSPPDDDPAWELVLAVDADGQPPEGRMVWWLPPSDE